MLVEEASGVVLATASYDHTIRFWNPATGACMLTKQHNESQVNAMALTSDKGMLGVAGYQHIRLHDLATATESATPLFDYDGISKNVTAIGFNPDSRWMLTGGEDFSARVWDLRMPHPRTSHQQTPSCQRIFQVSTSVNCICLHPNQTELFVGDASGTIHLWDLRNDHNEQFVPESGASVLHLDVDYEGTMLAAVNNKGMAYVWNLVGMRGAGGGGSSKPETSDNGSGAPSSTTTPATSTNTKPVPKIRVPVHKRYALKCRFSLDSTLLATTSADQTARVWRTADFAEMAVLRRGGASPGPGFPASGGARLGTASPPDAGMKWVWDCAFTADSQHLFTVSSDAVLRLWSVGGGEPLRQYQGHQLPITAMAFADAAPP